MKGIVLAGGLGTRLYPLTKVTNKHLLPVYNKPMVLYPLEALVIAGITDILLITGGEWATDFARLLADFKSLGIRNLYFAYQEKPLGIAHALSLAESFVNGDKCVVFLGDNVIEGNICKAKERFERMERGGIGALEGSARPSKLRLSDFGRARAHPSHHRKAQRTTQPLRRHRHLLLRRHRL